ncbi:MAG: basic amino acid ABC transporter substrate-binding protein [archaeon]
MSKNTWLMRSMAIMAIMAVCLAATALLSILSGCSSVQTNNGVSDDSLMKVKERGKLLVGTNLPYAPMEYYDETGKIVGFDIDIITKIASELGVGVEIQDVPWDGLFDDVKSGRFDVIIDTITINPRRMEEMLFSNPYMDGGQAIVIRRENDNIKELDDLKGRKVAVLKDTTGDEAAQEYVDQALLLKYESQDISTDHLKNKDADAMIVDYIVALSIVKSNPELKILDFKLTEEFYGIATKKGNDALMNEINAILREMRQDGTLDSMVNKWAKNN